MAEEQAWKAQRLREDFVFLSFLSFFGILPDGVAAVDTVNLSILDCAKILRMMTASAAEERRGAGGEDAEKTYEFTKLW